jgi:integrase
MSVYKRGDKGVFYMNFTVNGVRVYKSTGKFTKKEAKQIEANERQKLLDAEKMSPQEKAAKTLLLDAVDKVYEVQWKHGKDSERSYARGKNMVGIIGNIQLGCINENVADKFVQELDRRESEAGTINRYLSTLKTVLRRYKQPTDFIKLRKERKGRIRTVSREEEKIIIDLLRNTKHNKRRQFYYDVADLVEVLVDSGLRLGEALALDYESINFETNLMTIWINKGDRPRSIPMTSRVRNILERRKDNGSKPFDLAPYSAENAWRWVRKQMKLEHDEQLVLHCLRHTTCTRLLNKGIDVVTIKEWMGHADIKTTMIYMHLDPNKLAHAATMLEL